MKCARYALLVGVTLFAVGCSDHRDDLRDFVERVKARPAPPIDPIPEIAEYVPYTYRPGDRRPPFTPTERRRDDESSTSSISPDTSRAPGPLEQFPLDALRMVGTISRSGRRYALIQAPDNVIHRMETGEYLGQNNGQIDAVTDDGVLLTEIVPDGLGGYTERPATLAPSR